MTETRWADMSLLGLQYVARVALVTLAAAIIPFIGFLYIGGTRLERAGIPAEYWPVILILPAIVTFILATILYRWWIVFSRRYNLRMRIVEYCVSLSFVAGVSALIIYAGHGWTWPSEINGVTLNVPEFVIVIVLVTLPVGICIDMCKSRNPTKRK